MTYGIELRNALGEKIAGDGPQIYLKASGECRIFSDYSGPHATAQIYPEQLQWESFEALSWSYSQVVDGVTYGRTFPNSVDYRKQWIAASIQTHAGTNNQGYAVPATGNLDDLMFVEVNGNGILQASSYTIDMAGYTAGKLMQVHPSPAQQGTRLKYKIGSTDFPAPSGDNYGLQLFDASGNVEFDSRFPQLPIEDYFYLTYQQVSDILDGNLTFVRDLRVPITELYASLPTFWSWKYIGARFYTLHLKKLSDTQIQIGRAWVNMPDDTVYGQSIRDMMIYFAK
ncbi:MAG: hypothetical protein ACU0AU_04845 [Cognatishimia activa]